MIIGVPQEIKNNEYRVGMVPAGVEELVAAGHTVIVEKGAGRGSGISDREFEEAGAKIVALRRDLFRRASMIVKVKEPQPAEFPLIRPGQLLFCYFHFAASADLTRAILKTRAVAIAYETIRLASGEHPLLTPMSEVAGKMAIQEGAKYLERSMGGKGILLGGVAGVRPAKVVVLGGGVVGMNAAKTAAGLGARVTVLDVNPGRLRHLEDILPKNVVTLVSNRRVVREEVREADLLVGAVYLEGAKAPRLVTEAMVKSMKPGSVLVDVAIDQGGCAETSRPTTHSDPVYVKHGVVHYCVTNIPGAVGMTSTYALTNSTLPFALKIASKGYRAAAKEDPAIGHGLNIEKGRIVHPAVKAAFRP
ncbi:MAG TPA: alanine dehydrogenase [bacterium]|nr:alanine dehydrogenase [bacterium]